MLEVRNLSRSYGQFLAVNKVGFSIGRGEIVGLLGHNGAGKTTIMKMLTGYLEADEGTVYIDGIAVSNEPEKAQRMLGYLPENLPVYPELTVADYLDYATELKGITGSDKHREIRRAVIATDISDKLLDPISTLSRGYKQRVGIAQAILGQPKLLILDEPTNGLDPEQTLHIRQLIRDLAQEATVILSTHIMQEVDALCSRALIIRSGHLVVDENLNELRSSNHLLVGSNLQLDNLPELSHILGVASVIFERELGDEAFQYQISLEADVDMRDISAQVARHIMEQGGDVFMLQAVQRDLESLFHEVTASNPVVKENVNAA